MAKPLAKFQLSGAKRLSHSTDRFHQQILIATQVHSRRIRWYRQVPCAHAWLSDGIQEFDFLSLSLGTNF